ncbi:hypothetical protein ACFL2V_15060 [Pseudomonadota bacterium]
MFGLKKDPVQPKDLKNEAESLISQIKVSIDDVRNDKEFKEFPKQVLNLVRIEAQKEHGFEYDPSDEKLIDHLKHLEKHIVHEAYSLRFKNPSHLEMRMFCDRVEQYVLDLKKRMEEWD